jgi:hypothetical protein
VIRDRRKYRIEGFGTFEEYCRERWNWSRSYVHRQIEASQVAQNLLPIGTIPKNEAQARELARLELPEHREVANIQDEINMPMPVEHLYQAQLTRRLRAISASNLSLLAS